MNHYICIMKKEVIIDFRDNPILNDYIAKTAKYDKIAIYLKVMVAVVVPLLFVLLVLVDDM